MALCGRSCFAGWSVEHNVKPRTSRWGEVSPSLVVASAHVATLGNGFDTDMAAAVVVRASRPQDAIHYPRPSLHPELSGTPSASRGRTRGVPGVPVCTAWCHLLHCSVVGLFGRGESLMPINATGGSGELVTCFHRPGR